MTAVERRDEPPYRRIASTIRDRIVVGELAPGDPVPSTRQITVEWGVAMATATKVLATLRQEGLVVTRPGAGARVADRPASDPTPSTRTHTAEALTRSRIVAAALRVADREGLTALTIRRVASELGVGAMSLYRHVPSKDELLILLSDEVFGQRPLPDSGPTGWRERLELVSGIQWSLYQEHPWLAHVISFTRPLLAPNAMAHTEWTLRSLDGLGLDPVTVAREAITLPAVVRSIAMDLVSEIEAERESGISKEAWWSAHAAVADRLEGSGSFPMLEQMASDEVVGDFQGMYDHAVRLHLDGLAALIERGDRPARR